MRNHGLAYFFSTIIEERRKKASTPLLYFSHTFLDHPKRRNKSMPNKVKDANGEEYFVMDIEYYGKKGDRIRYLLDNGQWVKAEEVEVVD